MRGWWQKQARNPIGTTVAAAALLLTITAPACATARATAATPWHISTLAGGVGGPGRASQIAAGECAVSFSDGYLYATGYGYAPSVIRKISLSTGRLRTPVGSAFTAPGAAADGTPAAQASIGRSCGVTTDTRGDLFFTDLQSDLVEMVPATTGRYFGQSMTASHVYIIGGDGTDGYSGDGGPAVHAKLSGAAGLTVDPAGNVIFDDADNNVLRIIAARTGTFYGQPMTVGDIYTVAGGGSDHEHSGIPAGQATLGISSRITLDHAGNILVSDAVNHEADLIAVKAGRFYGRAMTAGHIYPLAGTGRAGYSGDDGLATSARLHAPAGIAVDHHGNVIVCDHGNARLRVIAARRGRYYGRSMRAGRIYTAAAELACTGVAVDAAGNLVAAASRRVEVLAVRTGQFCGRHMVAGRAYTIATGRPVDGVAVDRTGNVILASPATDDGIEGGGVIQVIAVRTGTFYRVAMTAGHRYTIAGAAQSGGLGDGGRALDARFNQPTGVAVAPSGALLVFDFNRIRIIRA